MKYLFLFLILFSCNKEEKPESIAPENDMCICTKEYRPVCADGQTFGNPCMAGCEGHKNFKEGPCN